MVTNNIWGGKEFESMLQEIKKFQTFNPTFILDDYHKLIETLDRAIDHLHKTYIVEANHLELVKRELINKLDRDNSFIQPTLNDKSITSRMVNDDVLLIQLDHLLPMINDKNLKEKHYFNELRNYYVPILSDAIKDQKPNFEGNKVFVGIVQYYPHSTIRDIDNHFIKFIFNSLRYSGLITDDTFKNVFYTMLGTIDDKNNSGTGYSEIYITESKNMQKVMNLLPLESFL